MAKCISFQMDVGGRFVCGQYSRKCTTKGRFKINRKKDSFDNIDENKIFETQNVKGVMEKGCKRVLQERLRLEFITE